MQKKNVRVIKKEVVVNREAVEILEEILGRAKSGELDGVCIAATYRNGNVSTRFNSERITLMSGALSILSRRFMDAVVELSDD